MDGTREILFVSGDDDGGWAGTEDFAEVAFSLDEGVRIGAVDDEDDAVGASGKGFADEAELLEAWAAKEVSFEVPVFEGTKVKTDGGAIDIGGDGVVGDAFDECGFADTLGSNDKNFEMSHTATRND